MGTLERGVACRGLLQDTLPDEGFEGFKGIRTYLQQQRALGRGRNQFQAMVEAKTLRFAGIRPAHRPQRRLLSSK